MQALECILLPSTERSSNPLLEGNRFSLYESVDTTLAPQKNSSGANNVIQKPCRHDFTKCVRVFVRTESCSLAACCVPSSRQPKPAQLSLLNKIKGGMCSFTSLA